MRKQKWIVHILSLLLTIVMMFIISRVLVNNTAFIMQHKEVLPYVLVIILALAGFSVYLLYQIEKTK